MKRTGLAVRITALCLAVAGIAVLVAGVVSARLVSNTAVQVSRETLADQADVIAGQLDEQGVRSRLGLRQVAQVLHGQGVGIVLITADGVLVPAGGDTVALRAARKAGVDGVPATAVSATPRVAGEQRLVEARPAAGGGIVLVQEATASAGPEQRLRRNLLFALAIGLLVAAVAGLALSRVLARPLRRTAGVALTMSEGRRDVRVPVEGPREVAEVAAAVNGLAEALTNSEARQREFLLSVSHELRTPLTSVSGFAESLTDGVVSGPEAGAIIKHETDRLQRLVNDLLDLAKMDTGDFVLEPRAVDLTDLLRSTADVWAQRCERDGVLFRWEAPDHPVLVHADPVRLRQVLDGLADNALRVTPSGAPIVLSLEVAQGNATLRVRDGGPGLSESDYPVAFQRGALHARYAGRRPIGSGVGLALAHGLVQRMGGTMQAGPAPEGGACFTVLFRLSR